MSSWKNCACRSTTKTCRIHYYYNAERISASMSLESSTLLLSISTPSTSFSISTPYSASPLHTTHAVEVIDVFHRVHFVGHRGYDHWLFHFNWLLFDRLFWRFLSHLLLRLLACFHGSRCIRSASQFLLCLRILFFRNGPLVVVDQLVDAEEIVSPKVVVLR